MSHATSARNLDKDRLRHRPSATVRDMSVENAPVLFRLPVIPPHAGATAAAPHHDSTTTTRTPPQSTQGSTTPQATVSVSSAVAIEAGGGSPMAASETKENSWNSGNGKEGLIEPAIVTAPMTDGRPAQVRTQSWWEHWSSGVVLILLIIGLVTASILALNDDGKARVEQLAGEPLSASLDEFDLSNITIPDVESNQSELNQPAVNLPESNLPPANQPIVSAATVAPGTAATPPETLAAEANAQAAEAKTFATNATHASSTELSLTSQPAQSPATTVGLQLSASATPSPTTTSDSQPRSSVETDLAAPSRSPVDATTTKVSQAQLGVPAAANLAPSTKSAGPPSATAASPHISLDTPLAITAPPLFSAEQASTANNQNGSPLPLNTGLPPLPTEGTSGTSPALYDGAAMPSQLHAAFSGPEARTTTVSPVGMPQMTLPSSSMPGMVAGTSPRDTQLPSYATLLTSATTATAGTTTPGMATPVVGGPSAGGQAPISGSGTTAVTTAQSTTLQSATPELDLSALIEAYRHYSEINKASNGVISNRWTSGTATAPNTSGQTTPSTGGMGFTLGSPTSN